MGRLGKWLIFLVFIILFSSFQNFSRINLDLGVVSGLPKGSFSSQRKFNSNFIVEIPKTSSIPNHSLNESYLYHSINDAKKLGFYGIKLRFDDKVIDDPCYYYLPTEKVLKLLHNGSVQSECSSKLDWSRIEKVSSLKELASTQVMQFVFNSDIKTFLLETDVIGKPNQSRWGILNKNSSGQISEIKLSDLKDLYQQYFELAEHFLVKFKTKSKLFILQDIQSDWMVLNFPWNPMYSTPSRRALENYLVYLRIRQLAVEDARLAHPLSKTKVFNLCDSHLVRKSSFYKMTSISSYVFPKIKCDLYGYNAMDSLKTWFDPSRKSLKGYEFILNTIYSVNENMRYLKRQATHFNPYFSNQIAITKLGASETIKPFELEAVASSIDLAVSQSVPLIVVGNLYDNTCDYSKKEERFCSGNRMLKNDGRTGKLYNRVKGYILERDKTFIGSSEISRTEFANIILKFLNNGRSAPCIDEDTANCYPLKPMFNDVLPENSYYKDIQWIVSEKIMGPCSSNQFCPNGKLTRAEVAQILINIYKRENKSVELEWESTELSRYTDISMNHKFLLPIEGVSHLNLMDECLDSVVGGENFFNFCPDNFVSKNQLMRYLSNLDKIL